MRINISIPDEWHEPLEKLAAKRGISLSRLLYESAAALLPAAERKKLPEAKERGRPRKDS
jgi:hypothetical protein